MEKLNKILEVNQNSLKQMEVSLLRSLQQSLRTMNKLKSRFKFVPESS
jgi:hypothetical protein